MMGVRKRAFSGVFIEENAHRSRSPCLHLQGKWSRVPNTMDGRKVLLPVRGRLEAHLLRQSLDRL